MLLVAYLLPSVHQTTRVCCESSWVLYRCNAAKLSQFHMRYPRHTAHIRWQDKIPNTEVIQMCGITGIEAFLLSSQLCWTGHLVRKSDDHLPNIIFYGKLSQRARLHGGQLKRFKDALKANLTNSRQIFLMCTLLSCCPRVRVQSC